MWSIISTRYSTFARIKAWISFSASDGEVVQVGNIALSHAEFVARTVGTPPEGAEVVTIGKSGGEVYALTSRTFIGSQTYASPSAQTAAQAMFR